MTHYDIIIVGGGSAGCVLASRLSEKRERSVLLLEAGADTPNGDVPPDILNNYPVSYFNKSYVWPGLRAHWRKAAGQDAGFPQARIMGGGSSIMGMLALRGVPTDFDAWAAMGAQGWSWADVLPWFRKLENDLDFGNDAAWHGDSGPVPIRRTPMAEWTPLAKAIAGWTTKRQLPIINDMNADFRDGYGMMPMSNTLSQRVSSAMAYLGAEVRKRSNLTILAETELTRLIFEGTLVTGVAAKSKDGQIREYHCAQEVILAAGAIHSPVILLRNGIGDAAAIRKQGIDVIADRKAVGANLQNHPLLFVGIRLHKNGRQSPSLNTHAVSCFRLSSGVQDCPQGDIFINIQSKTSWNALGMQVANVAPVLHKPFSRGRVSLAQQSARGFEIEFNFADDERDMRRLKKGFRFAVEMLADPVVRSISSNPFVLRFTDRLRRLNEYTPQNRAYAEIAARLFDLSQQLGDKGVSLLVGQNQNLDHLMKDDAALTAHIQENVAGTFHVCGTCRMGRADDPASVVDAAGLVHGVSGLRVVDASIMPTVPCANTNIPVIMLAEKIASFIN